MWAQFTTTLTYKSRITNTTNQKPQTNTNKHNTKPLNKQNTRQEAACLLHLMKINRTAEQHKRKTIHVASHNEMVRGLAAPGEAL